jgi:hypothetical protein
MGDLDREKLQNQLFRVFRAYEEYIVIGPDPEVERALNRLRTAATSDQTEPDDVISAKKKILEAAEQMGSVRTTARSGEISPESVDIRISDLDKTAMRAIGATRPMAPG